jgi:hypothetical protein
MRTAAFTSPFIADLRARRHAVAPPHNSSFGDTMSIINQTTQRRPIGRFIAALTAFLLPSVAALVTVVGFTTTAALACACGCSVFDVGGLDLPQEQDHGGRVFLEYWSGDQTENYIGSSRASGALNSDKEIKTQWVNVGFSYNFNRDWGVMVRVPTTFRTLTTTVLTAGGAFAGIQPFSSNDIGDIEIMGMYTGFFNDLSTGILFGLKLPTGPITAFGIDRDTQIGSGSTDLMLGAFHRGLLSGDNAWQYFSQILWRQPFLYRAALDPQAAIDANPNPTVPQTYFPGAQIDGAVGINYNNLYHVLGFDKITPLAQVIVSHRNADSGTGADPFNSGFDRVMLSPGVELTKVVDEANNRVVKFYADVEVPIYYRANAANNAGTEGQLVAPYLIKAVASYNF